MAKHYEQCLLGLRPRELKQSDERGSAQDSFLCSVQSLSRVRLFVTPWTAACQASLSITNSWSLLKLISIKSVMPSNHLILCHPLFLLHSIVPIIRVFSHQVAKVLELQLQHQSFQWIFGVDFLQDWLVWSPCCPRDSQHSSKRYLSSTGYVHTLFNTLGTQWRIRTWDLRSGRTDLKPYLQCISHLKLSSRFFHF